MKDATEPSREELLALANDYEDGLNRALASGYEEFGPTWERRQRIIINALRASAPAGNGEVAKDNDIGILLSVLRNFKEAVGEAIDDTEGVVAQIEHAHKIRTLKPQDGGK